MTPKQVREELEKLLDAIRDSDPEEPFIFPDDLDNIKPEDDNNSR